MPPGTRLSRPQGGFVLWVELPPKVDTMKLYADALKHRVNIAPGPLFSVKERYRNCLRLNCGIPWSESIGQAIELVGRLARQQA
jgi:DNA-binding transcriptional MocR family regulator